MRKWKGKKNKKIEIEQKWSKDIVVTVGFVAGEKRK